MAAVGSLAQHAIDDRDSREDQPGEEIARNQMSCPAYRYTRVSKSRTSTRYTESGGAGSARTMSDTGNPRSLSYSTSMRSRSRLAASVLPAWAPYIAVVLSALVMWAAFPPLDLGPLAFFAPIPLFWAIRRVESEMPGYFSNARVVVVGGTTQERTIAVLREFTDNIIFDETGHDLTLPGGVKTNPVTATAAGIGELIAQIATGEPTLVPTDFVDPNRFLSSGMR